MATHANSTTAPARPLLPLRGPGGRFAKRTESTAPLPCDASALASKSAPEGTELSGVEPPAVVGARTTVAQTAKSGCFDITTPCDLDALVAPRGVVRVRFGEEQLPFALAEGDGLHHGGANHEPDSLGAIRADIEALVAVDPVIVGVVDPKAHAEAHARFMRRALAAAVDHGVALLAALGLPQLVGPDHIAIDPEAAGAALDDAIAALDEADGDADLEDGADDEETSDDEHTLGWREAVSQVDLGHGTEDGEHSLGAPERHPILTSIGSNYYEPAAGKVGRMRNYASQDTWAQGCRLDGEREAEAGYDLPCDTNELDDDGLWQGEGDESEKEPSLGAPLGDGDQRHWAQGEDRDVELVNEDGGGLDDRKWFERPIGPVRPVKFHLDHRADMRALIRFPSDGLV